MTDGVGNVSGRKSKLDNGSTDECHLPCCVCIKKKIRTESDKYCLSCLDYFCKECVRMHDFLPALSDHVIVDKGKMTRAKDTKKILQIPTKRCPDHSAKIVDMYCKTHHQVGCTTCIALQHNNQSCDKLYILENIDSLFHSDEITQARTNMSAAVKKLKDALALRSQYKEELKTLKNQAENALESFINEIFSKIDELKKETTACLEEIFLEIDALVDEQTDQLNTCLSKAEDVLDDAKRSTSESSYNTQQFVCGIFANIEADKCITLNKQLTCLAISSIIFTPHVSVDELLKPFLKHNTIGTFKSVEKMKDKENNFYKAQSKRSVNVYEATDKTNCWISGSCSLPNDTILLADNNNYRLKRLFTHQSSDHLDLPTGPRSVCAISQQEAAATLPSARHVQFVSIRKTMEKTRTMKLDFECYGIAYHSGELYISDSNTTVYVYTTEGKLLRQFCKDKSGVKLFFDIRNMTVSESGRVLYVADSDKGLIAVDTQSGHKLWQYADNDLRSAAGVCVDGRGSVFVVGYISHNVLQISENGEKIAEILTKKDGIFWPLSLCLLRYTNELVVKSGNESKWFALNT